LICRYYITFSSVYKTCGNRSFEWSARGPLYSQYPYDPSPQSAILSYPSYSAFFDSIRIGMYLFFTSCSYVFYISKIGFKCGLDYFFDLPSPKFNGSNILPAISSCGFDETYRFSKYGYALFLAFSWVSISL